MAFLLTAAVASRIEKSGNDLAEICQMLSADRRYRDRSPFGGTLLSFKREALIAARKTMEANTAIRTIDVLVRNFSDSSVDLLRVGRRGGWKRITRVWNKDGAPC